jgi:hypothetical protein
MCECVCSLQHTVLTTPPAAVYKLGDLGLINAASNRDSFEVGGWHMSCTVSHVSHNCVSQDGDSRYLPNELLNAEAPTTQVCVRCIKHVFYGVTM